jgi:hypothetical protein
LQNNPIIQARFGHLPGDRLGGASHPVDGRATDLRHIEHLINRQVGQRVKPVRHRVKPLFARNPGNEFDVRRLFSAFGHLHH